MSATDRATLYEIVKANVVTRLEAKGEMLRAEKLRAYLPYREARETLRRHELHLANVRNRGIDALTGGTP